MLENFIVTDHMLERYAQRVGSDKKETYRRIRKDLHFTKVRRIVNDGNHRHVFTLNSKEFIFKKDGNIWILKTIIKRSRQRNPIAIQQRIAAASN